MKTLTLKEIILLYNEILKKDFILKIETEAYNIKEPIIVYYGLLTSFVFKLDVNLLFSSVLKAEYDDTQNKVTITIDGATF